MLKSPLIRIGGKYFLRNWVVSKIPKHTLFCEPFCGAGHLILAKEPSKVEVVNDLDGHLIGFFKTIVCEESRERLVNLLQYMPYSRKLWQELRTKWKRGIVPNDPVEAAAQWFYLNRSCFSSDMMRGGFALPSTTGRDTARSFRNAIDSFEGVARRLRTVTIECLDYKDCISKYDSSETLFYVDPPYLDAEHYYSKDSFGLKDHYKLAEILNDIKGKAMVSHYSNEVYDSLYKGWCRYEYESFKGSHKSSNGESKPKTVEVLYCNSESEENKR